MQSASFDIKDLCVRAGAGAGKTTNLTQKVLEYALSFHEQMGHWPKVVVTTFTRKATQELRERLLKRAVKEYPEALEFVRASHLLTVSTMHGLMDRYLRTYGMERGLSPQFSIAGQDEGKRYKRRLLRRVLKTTEDFSPLLRELRFKEIMAFLEAFRSRKFTSSPWSFITAEDQKAVAWEQFHGCCAELSKTADQILSLSPRPEWEEFASQLQSWPGHWKGRSWLDVHTFAPSSLIEIDKPRLNKKVDSPELQDLSKLYQKIRDKFKIFGSLSYHPDYWQHLEAHFALFERLSERFESELEAELLNQSVVLLEDLENQAVRLLREHPGTARDFGSRWNYWMIDEYQDTSPLQVYILSEWVQSSPIYVVGDPQQSIYLFRGARQEVFQEMWERTQQRGETLFLKKNYRSDPELLNFINWSIQALGPSFESMEAKASAENQEPVATLMKARDGDEEWLQIKKQIVHLLEAGGVRPDQICILARTRKGLRELAERLQEAELPYYLHGGSNFLQRRAVLDVLQVLKFLLNPWDDKNLVALLRSPWVGCPDAKIQQIAQSSGKSLWEKLKAGGAKWPETELLVQLHQRRAEQDLKSIVFDFCKERFIFATSYFVDASGLREANLFKAFHWIENFLKKPGVNLLEVFQAAQTVDLEGHQESDAVSTLEPNRIQLMTCHAAKGLEADYVFLPLLHKKQKLDHWHSLTLHEEKAKWGFRMSYNDSESALAHPMETDWVTIDQQRQADEELRVFYVGLTRAKKKLFLSWQIKADGSPAGTGPAAIYSPLEAEKKMPFHFLICEPMEEAEKELVSLQKFKLDSGGEAGHHQPWRGRKESLVQKTSVTREIAGSYKPQSAQSLKKGLEKSVRGERVHRLFELLKMQDPKAMESYLQRWFAEDTHDVLAAIEYLRELQEPPLSEVLANGEAEWPFLIEWDSGVLEGQLDLFGRDGQGRLWVVDYKSGSTAYRDKAFEQLRMYAQALTKAGVAKKEKVYLCALYPFEKKAFVESVEV